MALDFPASPSIGDKYTVGGVTWTWDGTTWKVLGRFQVSSVETDPVFAASPASDIVLQNILNWNNAYSWGNHADRGYLTTFGPVPETSTSSGSAGEIRYDVDYLYICVATNTWKRTPLSSW
jgi:hypothetical protein